MPFGKSKGFCNQGGELMRLRDENATLRARVAELENDRTRLWEMIHLKTSIAEQLGDTNVDLITEHERLLSRFLGRALTPDFKPGEIVLARWDGAGLNCLTDPGEIREALTPKN